MLSHQTPLRYTVEEQACISKTGRDEDSEDVLYLGPYFVEVIDGATSKTERRWDSRTGGGVAAELVRATFDQLSPAATARQAVDAFTQAIKNLYERYDVLHEVQAELVQRAVACFVAVSLVRREVWLVGDCQCRLDDELLLNEKEIDHILTLSLLPEGVAFFHAPGAGPIACQDGRELVGEKDAMLGHPDPWRWHYLRSDNRSGHIFCLVYNPQMCPSPESHASYGTPHTVSRRCL